MMHPRSLLVENIFSDIYLYENFRPVSQALTIRYNKKTIYTTKFSLNPNISSRSTQPKIGTSVVTISLFELHRDEQACLA